mgnify:CR=1 FL=1
MIKHNIFIINFKLLYEILDEIKDNLSFAVIAYENAEIFTKEHDLDIKNSLIISRTDHKLLLDKGFNEKNLLNINIYPIQINKIVELINIQLIKLKFNHQSQVNIKGYELNLNSKFFSKDEVSLKLTEKEIEIILYLNAVNKKHDVLDLQKNIWGYPPDMETHTVETHIYRLRKKINEKFKDEKFILTDKNGYFIE